MFNIHNDNLKPILLVGKTAWNMEVYNGINHLRDVRVISVEEFVQLEDKKNYQYFTGGTDTSFRKMVVEKIEELVENANFVSFVSASAQLHPEFKIGKNSLVCSFVASAGPTIIGDHCIISHFCHFGHEKSILGDYCFIGPYTSIVDCNLAKGTWCGHNCRFLRANTKEWSQYYMNSKTLNKTFEVSGTYKNNKLLDPGTCLTHSLKD